MHIKDLDLNLLRLFDEVYRCGSVSAAAERLDITQPAASQGLARLRVLLKDPLFTRAARGVRPTARATALAESIHGALATLTQALEATDSFDPATSRRLFRLHMSDVGEGRFLPVLMTALNRTAPAVRIATQPLPHEQIVPALDSGAVDFAFGFLPGVKTLRRRELLEDRYVVLLRKRHPMLARLGQARTRAATHKLLRQLDFMAVISHADTVGILQHQGLEDRLRLTTQHFMALPSIVRATDLCAIVPRDLAREFVESAQCALFDPDFERSDFPVALHWSPRFENDPAHLWFREFVGRLFRPPVAR